MFSVGDKVVYPVHGAGIVRKIEDKMILGKKQPYYIINIFITKLDVMVPARKIEEIGIRKVKTKEEMDTVLSILRSEEVSPEEKSWNQRVKRHQEIIKSGELENIARVVKYLESANQEKSLSTGEMRLLHAGKRILISEMALVYEKSLEDMETQINEALCQNL